MAVGIDNGDGKMKNQQKNGKQRFDLMASMMCADYGHLADEVKALEQAGASLQRDYCEDSQDGL